MSNKYWWREEENGDEKPTDNRQQSTRGKYWWRADSASSAAENIANRVNTWLKNHNTYISNYQTRNSGRKYNYEDSYVSDSADWLNTVSQQKSAFDAEADSILSYMDQHKDYLDADWMSSVRKTLTDARGAQDIVLGNTRKDNEWWSSFGSEEMLKAHGSAEEAYKANQRYDGYSKKYSGQKYQDIQKALKSFETNRSREIAVMESDLSLYKELSRWEQDEKGQAKLQQLRQKYGTIDDLEKTIYEKKMAAPSEEEQWLASNQDKLYKGDSNYMSKAASGYKSYEAQKIAEWKEEESKTWFDKALESFATTPADTSLPNAGLINAQVAYTNDTTYREPNDEWSTEQKNRFGYLWTEDKQKAYAYAEQVNNQINAKKKYDQQQAIGAAASDNFWSGVGHTLGAIVTAPTGIVDYLDDIAEYTARGTITQKEFVSPFEYSQAAQSGIANKLNGVDENGVAQNVLDEDIPIIGGKGWGDIYSLGVSTANSMLSALAFGGAGTLVNFIGQGGAAGVDDALSRGATAEQALMYGTIVGSLEGLTEMIPAEKLIKAGSSARFKNWLKKALQQGVGEFFEEGASSFFGNLADDIIMRDKSNYNLMVKQLMQSNPGMSAEEASKIAFKQMAGDIAFDAIGGAASGFASGGITGAGATAIDSSNLLNKENVKAKQKYGGSTDALIQEGLQNNPNSESYQLAQKYQKQVEGKKNKDGKEVKKGKELSGFQIRNLLAANHEQTVEQTKSRAKDRLKELGENASEIYTIADIVTKKVYGQELTRSEKSTLANSFGSQVAKEIDDARKLVAALVQSAKEASTAHKSLTDRLGEESNLSVSESGQTTIRGTDEAFDIKKAEVATLADGQLTFKTADGNEVSAEDIDWADEDTAYLVSAVSRIENITPGDATVLIHNYDASSDMSVGEYVNGIDEAFTYGYNNYSVEDMKAGRFTTKLSDQQMMSAYQLGKTERSVSKTAKADAIKRMRTAVDAEVEKLIAEGKTVSSGKMTITYNAGNGKVVDFDQAGMKLSTKQKAAPALAKVMHEMGLGTNFELFSSYLSKTMKDEDGNRVRVFLNEKGEEEVAYSGVYRMEDGTVRIDLNAYNGRGLTLDAMSHELTHFIQQWSGEKYEILTDFLVKTYEKTDMSMHQRVLREQARLERIRKKDVSYSEAYDEVVANAMSKMLADGKVMERLQELKAQDMELAEKLWEGLKNLLKKFFRVYEKESALFYDAADLMELKEEFEQMQKMWADAFVEASENFQASLTAAENQILTEAGIGFDESTKSVYSLHFSNAFTEQIQVGKKAFDAETIAQLVSKATGRSIEDAREWVKSEMAIANIVMQNPEFLDFEADNRYEAIKKNSDYPQGTVDLSNLCPKREEFTAMFDMLQKKYPNKLFTAQDIADMRKILSENDITVACGACFVEDRRQLIGEIADTFIGMWKEAAEFGKPLQKTNAAGNKIDLLVTKALAKQYGLTAGTKIMAKDTYIPNQYDLTTYEGFKLLEKNHPTIAMAFNRYNNSRGQQSARLIEGRAEYKRQILGWSDAKVKSVNNNGGLRIFSFSDFEVVHLLDLVQVIIDCAAKGVKIQGYTKIPAFAKLVRGTGIKLNRSLIPSGDYGYHMENGKVVLDYDTTEGINIHDENFMDESDNPNVGNIVIGINPTQISAAMLDPFIDYIIPFHSNKAKEILRKLGTGEWVNYKESQHEKDISTGKASKHNVNIYTEVINKYHPKNKVEFVEAFLKECKRQGKIPRYAEFLNVDANGDYTYREGYHKLLVDFKMFDKDGNILPQGNITPNLEESFMKKLLNAEIDKKQNYEFPKKVYDAIDKKFGERLSSQETDIDTSSEVTYHKGKTVKQEVNGNGTRKESREAFLRRAGKALPQVKERGSLAYGYRQYHSQLSPKIRAAKEGLTNLRIPVVVFDQMESNKNGVTTIYHNDALAIPGVAVFIHKDATVDGLEIVGHEGYHYLRGSAIRYTYEEVLASNVDFASRELVDYQQKYVGDIYFTEDVEIDSPEWVTFIEEVFAYITGDIHAGDPKGEVHRFLRDYDAVKAAWDKLLKKQAAGKGERYSFQQTDLDGNTMSDRAKEILANAKPKMIGKTETANIEFDTVRELFNELNADKDIQALADRVFEVAKEDVYGHYGYASYNGEPKSHLRLPMAFVGNRAIPEGVHGQFRKNTIWGDIVFSYDYFMDESVAPQSKASTILHEVIHAVTCSHIESAYRWSQAKQGMFGDPLAATDFNGVDERIKAGMELIDAFEQVRSAPTKDGKNLYGQLTAYEMVAEMANVEFRNFLKKQNLWSRIVDAIKRIFGIPKTTAYDAVSDALERILTETTSDADTQRAKIEARKANNRYSSQETDADNAPTFYSQMGKVVEGMKQEKFGASSVISMLRGRGVKAEEIRWSGIQAFLDGKKSVTKSELLEFIKGSMLHIEEQVRGKPQYTEKEQKNLEQAETDLFNLIDKVADCWQIIYGTEMPLGVVATDGTLYGAIKRQIRNARTRPDISEIMEDADRLKAHEDAIRELNRTLASIREVEDIRDEIVARAEGRNKVEWEEYRLPGGENYREILFKMPGSTYRNQAMEAHWGDRVKGVLAHARMQDFDVDGKKMLFIEEIQSDWHNEGARRGYGDLDAEKARVDAEYDERLVDLAKWQDKLDAYNERSQAGEYIEDYYDVYDAYMSASARVEASERLIRHMQRGIYHVAPDAPFKSNYHEYVLKRLLRMAAEEGYDSIGWTTAQIQSDRWSSEYAEGYRIEYDQDMPKFLKKYGKQWGATVGKTDIHTKQLSQKQEADILFMADILEDSDDYIRHEMGIKEVWSMDITPAMKESVLTEGQALYSSQETDLDSKGKQLAKEQVEFFKDSMVRDRNGRLLVVYHGGTVEYVFDTTRGGNGSTQYGPGAYFTDSEYYAREYTYYRGGDVKPYYLNIEKLFDDTDMDATARMPQWKKLEQILRSNGIEEKFIKRFAEGGFAYMSRYLALKADAKTSDSWAGSEQLNAMLREAGYQGIKGTFNDVHQFVVFNPEQAKLTTNKKPTADKDIRFSTQHTDNITNRHLLANAFEGLSRSSAEYKMIQDYKEQIKVLNLLDDQLSDLNAEIREIRFTKGKYDAEKLRKIEKKAERIARDIDKQDKVLIRMEASEPLRKIIAFERKKAAQKAKDHVNEIQQNKKVRAEQTELRHKIRKAIRDLDKILKHGNKQKNVKEDLLPVVTKALQSADILFTDNYGTYDMLRNGIGADLSDAEEALVKTCTRMLKDLDKMPTDGYDNFQARQEAERKLSYKMSNLKDVFARERKRLNSIKVSSILGELADAYASLEKSEQSYVQGAYTEAVHNFLKNLQSEVGGTIVKDMTKDQLEYVYTAYKMVLTTVRKANEMFNKELKMSREQLGNAVIQEVMNAGGVHGLWTKAELAASKADWNNMKPIWVANRIGSETFGKLMQGLFQGQYNFAVDVEEAKQFKLSMDEKYKPRSWDAEKLYEFESSTGKAFSLNLQQIMSLYAFSKREQAYSHLLNGGFVFEGNSTVIVDENGRKKTYIHNGATSYKLNEVTLNEIINSLTKEQKAYVDEMQKYLSEVMGAKGNEVSMQLYGIKMFKEQFYFPLRSSGAYMERAKEAEMKKQQGQINLVNSGFTHAVKPEAKNPIILSGFMDVWAEHCNEMSMYHSMVLPMEDFRKVYNYSTVHDDKFDSASVFQTIQDAYGDAATAYIDQLYRELNAGATIDPRETTFKKLISNFKKTAVMLSASVVVQQFSSIGRAYALIDPKYFIGTRVNSDTQLSVAEEMRKYAPVAIIKEMGGFDTGTKGSAKSYIMAEKYGKGEWLQGLKKDEQYRSDLMGILPAKADEKTWCAIWEAVKRETKAKYPKMDVKSEDFLKLAGDRFSEVIEKTQVYDSVLARSANMRSKTGLMQMATSFMAEPTTTVNLLEDAIRRGDKKHMARVFGAVAVSIVLNNALASIVYAMRDDDEDETFIEKYFQSFTSGMIDDINPMSYYPFLKDVYSLFQGYDVERADMSVIADLRDALKKAVGLIGKDTSSMDDDQLAEHYKTVNSAIRSLLDAGCSVFGVPLKNVRRDANGIINAWNTVGKDLTERDTSWNSFWDKVGAAAKDTIPIYAWTKDEPKQDKLYEAIVSGDKAYLARLKSTYKTDSAYQSAVRKALRENDSRIHEAAQAKYDGKTEEYKRIFRQIQKEGKFSFDDIMSSINSEESAIRNKLEPDKVTSSYTASDFVESIVLGDSKSAEAMKEDIIATKVANGKTPADAEKEFTSAVATGIHDAYSSGLLDKARAENMLMEYAGKAEEEAASKVNYWAFCEEHPQYELTESNVTDYQEFAEPAEISLDVFVQYINGTKGISTKYDQWGDVELTVREQTLDVIDSLPLTWQQKDALYLAAGYSESKIWDVPW